MKRYIILLSAASCVLLSGCSIKNAPKGLIKPHLLRDNEQYDEYLSLKEQYGEKIDANGYYVFDEIEQDEIESNYGAIHVSFAYNSLINVNYYMDPEYTEEIDTENCYLYPGDTIYARADITDNAQSDTYEFSGFQIAGFNGEQHKLNYADFEGNIITIPNDIQYKEISIIPNGTYKKRNLTFQAEYRDDDGNTLPISIVWEINAEDKSYSTTSDSYSLDKSNSAFRIKAQFDSNEYYLIEDEAEPYYEDYSEKDGKVIFSQYEANDAVNDYKLVFGKKYNISIKNVNATGDVNIWIGGEKFDSPDFPFNTSAKLGTEVRIESTGGTIFSVGNTENLKRLNQNGYVYSVGNESNVFEFDPSEYTYSDGKVTFYDVDHNIITEKASLTVGDVIYYKGEPNDGFAFNKGGEENKINIDLNIDHMLKNELKFTPVQTIPLPQPEKGGTITYYLNGEEITGDSISMPAETDKLTASFKAAERYKTDNISDQTECFVEQNNHNIKFKNNNGEKVTVKEVFVFSETQKPNLNVKLDKSVGKETKFNIYNGETPLIAGISCKSEDKKKLKEIFEDIKVETVSGLKVSVSDWSRLENEALRIDVTKTDNNKKKTEEVYYILNGSGVEIISTNSGKEHYYTDIDIEISKVEGSFFNSGNYPYRNGKVSVYYDDVSRKTQIKDGEFVDNSRKVRMVLTADDKYQIYKKKAFSKKDNVVDKYEEICKYKDLDEKYSTMKSETKIQH